MDTKEERTFRPIEVHDSHVCYFKYMAHFEVTTTYNLVADNALVIDFVVPLA